jgi:hypothetical protein
MRKVETIVLILAVMCIQPLIAQSATVDTVWTRTFWRGYFDTTNCVQETSDGGFVITGVTWDEGETQTDIGLIKTDAGGNLEWSIELGDTASECGYHVLECVEGGYLISARSTKFGDGAGSTWIIRTDAAGDTLWTYAFSPEGRNGFPLYAIQTADSNFAITGTVNLSGQFDDAYILLLDRDGIFQDYAHYGDPYYQDGRFITEMPDSGFIVVVWTNDPYSTQTDFRAFRTTKNLGLVWDSTYAITASTEEIFGACRTEDGIVIVGNSLNSGYALKIDFDGNTLYSKSISVAPTNERPYSVCTTDDGGLMVGGWVGVTGHRRDFCFIKLNSELDMLWSFTVGGSEDDHGHSVVPTADGGFVLAGTSASFYNGTCTYLVKIGHTYNTAVGTDVAVSLDGGVTLTFENVTGEGDTELMINSDGPELPNELQIVPADPPTYYHIISSAEYDGTIEVSIPYDPADVVGDESQLTLMHYDGAGWSNILSAVDDVNHLVFGTFASLSPFAIAEPTPADADDQDTPRPTKFGLTQNHPNPFNSSTSIEFTLPERSRVRFSVFNMLGRKLVTLIDGVKPAGIHRVEWDGVNANGEPVATGVYFYRLQAGAYVETRRMLLLK